MANSYLTHSGSTPTLNTKCTLSVWLKRSKIDSDQTFCSIDSSGSDEIYYRFRSDNQLQVYAGIANGQIFNYRTNRLFRDTSAWYHIVVAIDTTASSGNRMKIYVNGVQETSFQSSNEMSQNSVLAFLSGTYAIGRKNNITGNYFDGYLSHVAFVDGSVVAPTSFGETDSTSGIWKFKSPSGVTWGTNGFHLKFENSGALGTDSSGQSNTFTVNGNLKQAVDTPSNNYTTLNPLNNHNSIFSLSKGGNTATCTSSWNTTTSSLAMTKGKWYWEVKYTQKGQLAAGVGQEVNLNTYRNSTANTRASDYAHAYELLSNGLKYSLTGNGSGSGASYTSTINNGDIVMFAFDATNGALWAGVNGTWANSATKSEIEAGTVTNAMYSSMPGANSETWFCVTSPEASGGGSTHGIIDFNFGNGFFGTTQITSAGSNGNGSLFEYDVPSGYYALNTKNLNTYG
jgi:hypothetical protein